MKANTTIKVPKPPSTQKMWIVVGIALFLLIFFVIIYSSYKVGSGKAIEVTEGQVIPINANLVTNDALILNELLLDSLTVGGEIVVNLETNLLSSESPSTWTLTLTKQEDSSYTINITKQGQTSPIAIDILNRGRNDLTSFYLDANDLLPDLQISSQDGKIIVKNLHFISPAISSIEFKTLLGADYPFIVRVPPGAPVKGTIQAQSSSLPALSVNLPQTLSNQINDLTSTTVEFSYSPPAAAGPVILTISSAVGTQKTNAYYLLAVDNVAFDQNQVKIMLSEARGNKANVTMTLAATTDLQTFIMPCTLTDPSVQSLFGAVSNSRVYTYDPAKKTTILWHQSTSIPDDFISVDLWKGYYVQLPTADSVQIKTACTIPEVISLKDSPVAARTTAQQMQKTLSPGWNLIALPGVVPQPLMSSFIDDTQFKLYKCNYNGASCQEISAVTPLIPGKPYWVYTTAPITLKYGLK